MRIRIPADDGLVAVLETALAQYHGDFLDDFDIDSDDFEAWILIRTRTPALWRRRCPGPPGG
ncbi:MAG: hypothetical protein U0452_12400 [Anaerolineae bacterium]